MEKAFTQRYSEDRSQGHLQFTFYCGLCGGKYTAPAAEMPGKRGLFPGRSWKKAYRAAFDAAQEDAREHFNRCVSCKQWVCDQDFNPDFGLCMACDPGKGG
ncbi:MAG TPA: hypothetical protein GXX75_00775 [Clostridiales bacterium]|nr:hypothetical protein [Clostridiales bacterium]